MTKYQFSKIKNVHYNFFSAERGFSSFPYNSLNCSFNTQDSYENIIENTINKMIEIGSLRKNILAIIGPTIKQNSYEIGNDLALKIECTTEYKSKNNILLEKSNKYFFNLPLFIKHKLNLNEINNISDVEIDTYLNKNFFSYRRITQNRKSNSLKKATGRQVSVIGLK